MRTAVTLTMYLNVHDPEAFAKAAQERAIAEGVDPADAAETYTTDNLGACAVMLIDPGMSPPGSEILDTETDTEDF